ncbi:zf-HC2 domain-containing protein [Streptomyces sp. AM 4-1-1]|uniref:zf-HC2 domain-containing protein n=1 Tax=Streptomyces sp. AM 4-1-1 TaxID=3028710 RepID=UPI0023B8E809|nr:zf-HC2 domain-containing protein [Streptomyces sp. AM 4-1-1]WEH35701.1 zf-HC2 domain-containing protein [Streptomyces sp. AM 4-1-1]
MSGTGPTPAEQHLGDRLAALVDGELKHDARERVLAHLATCAKCKAEADAQRRLKSVFAESAPPSPSEGFLARLQGLPGGPGGDAPARGRPFGDDDRFGDGIFPVLRQPVGRPGTPPPASPLDRFDYLPTTHGPASVLPGATAGSGLRIHEAGREGDRSPWRGRRLAFAAAGAVSLAAIALGATLPSDTVADPPPRAEGGGNTFSPLHAESRSGGGSTVSRRSGGDHPSLTGVNGRLAALASDGTPSVPAALSSAPALLRSHHQLTDRPFVNRPFALPLLSADASASPLIRPNLTTPLLAKVFGVGSTPAPAPNAAATAAPSAPTGHHGLPLLPRR